MGFFRKYQGKRSYDLFSTYSFFLPGYMDLIWMLLLMLGGAFIGFFITALLYAAGYESLSDAASYGMIITYPLMFLPIMIFASVKSRSNEYFSTGYALDSNNFGSHKGITMIFAVFLMTIASSFVIEPVGKLLPEMDPVLVEQMSRMMHDSPAWVVILSVSIFAPFFEEWLCRGLVLRGMLKRMKPWMAIALSALFFALIHGNIWQGIPAFFMGIVFGYVYYKTGSLKLTMLMHFVNNTFAYCIAQVPALRNVDYFMDILSPWTYAGLYVAAAMALAGGILLFRGIPLKENNLGGCEKIDYDIS